VSSVEPRRILKVADRCDWPRCGARAYARVILQSGPLDACGHHWSESQDRLTAIALFVVDETWDIP